MSPDETPLLTLFGTSTAKDTIHQWVELYQSRPTSVVSDVEGADTTFDDLTPPSRVSNLTHIIKRGVRVSRTERAVNVAVVGDPYAFQKADQLRLLKMDMEYALLNSTKTSGASGVAAQMSGIDEFITSMVTARNSGTSFSETELNDMGADAYGSVRADHVFDMVLCTVKIKQAIAGFSGNSTRYIDAKDRKLVKEVLVYSGSVGDHRIMHHRDVRNTAGTTTVYGLREDMHRVAYLDKPLFEELAKTGDADKGQIIGPFAKQLARQNLLYRRNLNVKTMVTPREPCKICGDAVETTRKLPIYRDEDIVHAFRNKRTTCIG